MEHNATATQIHRLKLLVNFFCLLEVPV